MKKFIVLLWSVVFVLGLQAQTDLSKNEVIKRLRQANSYFMNKWPDPGKTIVTNKERRANIWTRGVYYEGLMALYKLDQQKEYYDYAVEWGEKHDWKPVRGEVYTRHADNQNCGMTYIDLYRIDPQPERIDAIKKNIDSVINSGRYNDWTWIDAIQMAMPIYAKLGVTLKDTKYFDYMYKMYHHIKYKEGGHGLYNPADQLWWRDKDFIPPYKEPNGEDCYWSRGNGWVLAALALVLEELPDTDPHYQEYLSDFKSLAKALVPLQRADGFWNVSLHDPNHFGGKEASGTALFVYGMAWGVNHGILDKEEYLPVITKGWNALTKESLQPNGFLGYLQSTGKEPKDGQPVTVDKVPDFEDYGLGCFLLAGTEVFRLAK
ncbi:glycoside hydrolase family 88 protein [Sphingobacterium alkalisoli]|uniref:Glycoside hydrolase family 88 protein n=1 Tax=Sphingobacterium alkalisoli TaxID=1874115 RepID=A0A4U0H9K5_9SPHI|nr:glycoside hydrolase family 88 protein [Sphingobacterium alkalisoli]TJY68478.1 glycoside hydrolase family 88 protein [Sphingobacterium alkalisoli]GGH06218.1 glycosyl hydrolase family 88 [Sphingobacterium alkalisoli]